MKSIKIREEDVFNKGLDYVRGLDFFTISGNHYYPYPSILNNLSDDYHIHTEYYGSCDQGSTKTSFTKKTEEFKLQESIEYKVRKFEEDNGIKIVEYKSIL